MSALTRAAVLPLSLSLLTSFACKDQVDAKVEEAKAKHDYVETPKPPPDEGPPVMKGHTAIEREPLAEERHFAKLRQLTFGGENAEAYLSFSEEKLIFQSTRDDLKCDQIFTMDLQGNDVTMVSTGKGRTTCAYFLPGDERIVYASTHAAADDCLANPDRSKGYVWKLYDEFDIYVANADGSDPKVLSASPGYDAEATVSPKGDKIVFTSTRDGDPELYLMDIDGQNVQRLTDAPGYDGGAFFSLDGSKIVWRANRPEGEEELAKYQELRTEGLVRPTALELMVMNADGSDKRVITDNGAANFGPFWHPDGKRVIFSSNLGEESGREFDLFIIDTTAEKPEPEQVTHSPEFDGFPMFTRDGKQLIFASNRDHEKDGETNVFVADWVD
ncbi:PD40 domain-containing protein [Pseudenhygromyxa sp. WMMC2535]|uniref:TolB family protein n=1 Tax=Pseudenhygromyxa sp. WMMC2535 TaxID=2712867 RepID=UPI001554335C|nr:PD40 domain-containing protein [Pseudenhygromyxa sp. WMMC2535]NVB40630.1 PD40 domain-containing protein [Pseudenhygromyxa sp. WMMC2535]